jgi:ATP-binding cassette subfamily F protein 3
MSVSRLKKSYPNKLLFEEFNYQLKKGDRLFICGENGCGKSTLIKILAGRLSADNGTVIYGANVKVGYYDQENQDLHPQNTVLEEIWNTYPNMPETLLRNTLALFLFKGDDVMKRVSLLSGGEKARLTLTKLMLSKMNLLILDEPTNHLDINSRQVLEKAISDFEGTVIAASHVRYFVNKLATRIADFNAVEKGKLYSYEGTFNQYLEHKKNLTKKEIAPTATVITASKEQYLNAKRDQAEIRKQERRLKKAKDDVVLCEQRIEEINSELSKDKFFDYVELTKLSEELEACETKLLELYELIDELEGL